MNLQLTKMKCLGLLMLLDIPLERGFSEIDHRFGDPRTCHFPLFDFVRPLSFPLMSLVYALMWLGTDFIENSTKKCQNFGNGDPLQVLLE